MRKAFLLLLSCVYILNGCSYYQGQLKENFYGGITVHTKKIAAKVVIDNSRLSDEIVVALTGEPYTIKMAEGIYTSIFNSLDAIFQNVEPIGTAPLSDDVDFLVTPYFKVVEVSRKSDGVAWTGRINLKVAIQNAKNYSHVATYQKTGTVQFQRPGSFTPWALLTFATLYIAAPITFPICYQLAGDHGVALLEENFSILMEELSYDILSDKAELIMAANTVKVSPLSTHPSTETLQKAGPSKYDDFLESVVLVRSSLGSGSGFFVSNDGFIITNNHVVAGDESVSIRTHNGKTMLARVLETDKRKDLALLKVNEDGFRWLGLGNLSDAKIGSEVIAIGNPMSLDWSLTKGIVSAYRDDEGVTFIQTDAAVNLGNSGGPLIDLKSGKAIGINSQGFRKDVSEGLNFAIAAQEIYEAFPAYKKNIG